MSTKFRLSDLVPAGFIAERISHIDDETCILLSSGATASCSACGSKLLLPPGRGPPLSGRRGQASRAHAEVHL
jgi:hypothetical protein